MITNASRYPFSPSASPRPRATSDASAPSMTLTNISPAITSSLWFALATIEMDSGGAGSLPIMSGASEHAASEATASATAPAEKKRAINYLLVGSLTPKHPLRSYLETPVAARCAPARKSWLTQSSGAPIGWQHPGRLRKLHLFNGSAKGGPERRAPKLQKPGSLIES